MAVHLLSFRSYVMFVECESLNLTKNYPKCGDVQMSTEMSKKVPLALLGIFIVIGIVLISAIYIQGTNDDVNISTQPPKLEHGDMFGDENTNPYMSSKLYSGPFAIFDESYGVDATVFFIGSDISQGSQGDILFVRPDGKIHHTLYFDGSQQAVNHYFTPVSSSDLMECPDCEFFGTWEIAFRPTEGSFYSSIHFEVEDDR